MVLPWPVPAAAPQTTKTQMKEPMHSQMTERQNSRVRISTCMGTLAAFSRCTTCLLRQSSSFSKSVTMWKSRFALAGSVSHSSAMVRFDRVKTLFTIYCTSRSACFTAGRALYSTTAWELKLKFELQSAESAEHMFIPSSAAPRLAPLTATTHFPNLRSASTSNSARFLRFSFSRAMDSSAMLGLLGSATAALHNNAQLI